MHQIVITSNLDDEMYCEQWLNVPASRQEDALQCICNDLNNLHPEGPAYYKVVELPYKLKKWEP